MANQIQLTVISPDELRTMIEESVKSALSEHSSKEPEPQNDELIKIDEVCKLFKVSKVTIHSWKKAGMIPFHRISRKIYFKKNEVIEALRKIERKSWS